MKIDVMFKCTQDEFNTAKSRDLIVLICTECNKEYSRIKKEILDTFTKHGTKPQFCSRSCLGNNRKKSIETSCSSCNKITTKLLNQYNNSKNHFCTQSCAATYSNKNKKTGTKRSKFELFIEKKLSEMFPDLLILYSDKSTITSELDIYIPSLKLAFEIQGIFHYEPIFGQEKLDQIQKNDLEKVKKCKELNINLNHINISQQKHFKEESSLVYLEEIIEIISRPFKD